MHCVYIMTNKRDGTLYIGLTSDLPKRVWEHKNNVVEGFTKKYGCHTLVYFEPIEDFDSALQREKQMKAWNRDWKIQMIEKTNPTWKDLSDNII
jgi:putative endonuclease